jgi:hypothetical protein
VVAAARLAASGGTSPAEVVELVRRQIVEVFGVDDCRFDPGLSHPDRPRLHPDESITWRVTLVDVEREGLPTLDLLELPVTWAGVERGAYC